ncbi:iron complex transport system ATP-binding protein [Amphibacillus marinus]|uniref:Iron complex transport system ATP-binding protein n=1 Tax=Amphibacillus marinus TaxID=872970 RepID=A0A1H8JZL9_9BACI|nr:ABC transporter ATP-binding protein [Amphibacillus marinus]SEN86163.1 iron complex transport system ATP-binding protein [Amphibacillus marinus]
MVLKLREVGLLRNGRWILNQINWEVKQGEHWALLGLNGAGKTALLHMLSAYHFPTTGEVEVLGRRFGKDELGEALRQDIGLVSQTLQGRFYEEDSAYQIILSGGFASIGLYATPTDDMRERAKDLLKELGCFHYANRPFYTLSQGERQRVMIARSLMGNPKLLILDEPTNGLDFLAKEQLLDAVETIGSRANAPTILYVTHHVDELLPIFKQTLMLKSGEVFASGLTQDLLTKQTLSHFFGIEVDLSWHHKRPQIWRC